MTGPQSDAEARTTAPLPAEWCAVMRHAQAFRPGIDQGGKVPGSALTRTGLDEASAVGLRFAETIANEGIDRSEVMVVFAPSDAARATARAFIAELGWRPTSSDIAALDPKSWPRTADVGERWKLIQAQIDGKTDHVPRVLVMVGHDPQTSWLLHHLVAQGDAGQRGAKLLPLARGELVMLRRVTEGAVQSTLEWVLSPSDEKAIDELRAKITSKMDTAKLLGTFLTAFLLFAAKELTGRTILRPGTRSSAASA